MYIYIYIYIYIYVYVIYVHIYYLNLIKEKPNNIFKMKIFCILPLSIHNIYKLHFKSTMFFCNHMNVL